MTWWLADGGDPAATAAAFLADHGLGLPTTGPGEATASPHGALEICGATIFVSAAAGAAMIGGAVGPPSPSPAVPDLAVVIYAHMADHPPGENDRTAPAGGAPQAESPQAESEQAESEQAESEQAGSVGPVWRMEPWLASWTTAEHAAAVRRTREAIARGDVYQVNVVGHASAEYVGDPWPALRRVLALRGARHAGILAGEGWAVASASPETLVRVEAGLVETRPIKGTRPATEAGRRELLVSAKERAEHIMIVDLERNDLARVARTGTVDVPDLFVVRRWCDLWQAESRVVARLADGVDLAGLLRAVCPGGSVTGAPKLAALEQIAALEPVGRGASMGALGWLDRDRLDLGLTIRTVAADANRVHLWTGGGITWDSDPEAEVAEAAAKAAPLRAALASPLAGPSLAPRASIRGG